MKAIKAFGAAGRKCVVFAIFRPPARPRVHADPEMKDCTRVAKWIGVSCIG